MRSVLVAFSGGVDSTFLLRVARDVLGEKVVACTASSETYPLRELIQAKKLAKEMGVRHIIINTEELSRPDFQKNPPHRCYFCKSELFTKLKEMARKEKLDWVLDASNLDDEGDFRPGMRAGEELGIRSLLREVKLTKGEIRYLSRKFGLPTWNKPSFACLASRIPYGLPITREKLRRIERGEEILFGLGFRQVRVRDYEKIARIEIEKEDFPLILREEIRKKVVKELKKLGYSYVTLDLEGYRSGSMNETLPADEKGRN